MTHSSPGPTPAEGQLAEVWGDVVSRKQLGMAIIIGAVVSLLIYWIALHTISPMASTPAVGKALAMLAGVVGCVLGGALCARLFRPKRVLVEEVPADATWQAEALDQIMLDQGALGRVDDLPPDVIAEMKQVGLYELFRAREAREAAGGAQ